MVISNVSSVNNSWLLYRIALRRNFLSNIYVSDVGPTSHTWREDKRVHTHKNWSLVQTYQKMKIFHHHVRGLTHPVAHASDIFSFLIEMDIVHQSCIHRFFLRSPIRLQTNPGLSSRSTQPLSSLPVHCGEIYDFVILKRELVRMPSNF
jgi:hypothetical protein